MDHSSMDTKWKIQKRETKMTDNHILLTILRPTVTHHFYSIHHVIRMLYYIYMHFFEIIFYEECQYVMQ